MKREFYEVYAKVIDANGAYNTLSGYPKVFDSHAFDDDINKTRKRAYGEYHEVIGAMCKRDDRQQQFAMIIRGSDGLQIEKTALGSIADLPDPVYTVTVENGYGNGEYTKESHVYIRANTPAEGYQFAQWTTENDLIYLEGNEFTPEAMFEMPAEDVIITATYEEIPQPEE